MHRNNGRETVWLQTRWEEHNQPQEASETLQFIPR